MDSRIERARSIAKLAAGFPSIEVSEETINTYVDRLSDVPLHILARVADALIDEAPFFPTVAEIRQKANAMIGIEYKSPVAANCSRCFGSGMEIYEETRGYNVARRCFHENTGKATRPCTDRNG